VYAHWPNEHVWPGPHAKPQPPQLAGSFCTSAQPAPNGVMHAESGNGQFNAMHWPIEQLIPGPHWMPQPPQLVVSRCRSEQMVPIGPAMQADSGYGQKEPASGTGDEHCPDEHVSPAAHWIPQPPQFRGSDVMSAMQ
jgi:hypothetical protein